MTDEVTGTIEAITRLPSSTNGNPRFRLAVAREDDGGRIEMLTTQSDAAYGYELGNRGHRVGDRVTFTLTKAGRISHGRPALMLDNCPTCGGTLINGGDTHEHIAALDAFPDAAELQELADAEGWTG